MLSIDVAESARKLFRRTSAQASFSLGNVLPTRSVRFYTTSPKRERGTHSEARNNASSRTAKADTLSNQKVFALGVLDFDWFEKATPPEFALATYG